MADPVEMAGDVVTGATALGGLVLVYLGSVVTSYNGFERGEQASIRSKHQIRAWFSVLILVLSLVSAACALISKWSGVSCLAGTAVVLLLITLACASAMGVLLALSTAEQKQASVAE